MNSNRTDTTEFASGLPYNNYLKYWIYAIVILTAICLTIVLFTNPDEIFTYKYSAEYPQYSQHSFCNSNIKDFTPAYPPPLINFMD